MQQEDKTIVHTLLCGGFLLLLLSMLYPLLGSLFVAFLPTEWIWQDALSLLLCFISMKNGPNVLLRKVEEGRSTQRRGMMMVKGHKT